eukprot:1040326-Amphidinium_carterae.1
MERVLPARRDILLGGEMHDFQSAPSVRNAMVHQAETAAKSNQAPAQATFPAGLEWLGDLSQNG